MIAKTNVQMRVGACPGLCWAQKSRTLLSKSIFFLLTIPESVLGMVLGEFVLEGWLKDIPAKAVVLAIEAVRNASCCGWEMAIPAPRAARIRGGLARWWGHTPGREARTVLSWERLRTRFQRSELCISTGGKTDAPEGTKSVNIPPKINRRQEEKLC